MSNFVRPEDKLKRILSRPELYLESFIKIVDKNGKQIPFKMNQMQKSIEQNSSKLNLILKARQGGGSTFILLKAIYICMTKPNACCLLLSMDTDSVKAIFNKLKQAYDSIPELIKVAEIRNNRTEMYFANGSIIMCGTMSRKSKARGSTLDLVHLSEFAFVDDEVAKMQLVAIEQALNNDAQLFIESTANGFNHFHEMWNKSVDGSNGYVSQFYSYLDTADMFTKQHDQAMQTFKNRHKREFTEKELTNEERDLLAFDSRFTLPLICWRRLKINSIGIDDFNQEYPLTPEMAFKTSGSTIFDIKRIHERILHLPKPLNYSDLESVDKGITKYINGSGLEIYHKPEKDKRYVLGVDCSEGLGGSHDSSTITVLDYEGLQMAQFDCNKIQPHNFAQLVYDLGRFYNTGLLAVDKASSGGVVLSKLKEWGYINIAKSKVYDERGKSKKKIGIEISSKSRPIMLASFREWVDTNQILINSKRLLDQMLTFVALENGRVDHMKGCHDDCIFSCALAIHMITTGHPHYI